MKEGLRGNRYGNDNEVKTAVLNWLRHQPAEFYNTGIDALVHRWTVALERGGDYVEKQKCNPHTCFRYQPVSGNSQEKDLHNLKALFSNLKKLVENRQKQLEEVEKKNDDLEQYSRSNCLIVHKCKDVPKTGKYLECENYICDKLNGSLPLDSPLQVNNKDIAHPLPSKKNVRGTPVIIKFLRRTQRNEIYAKKIAPKGKGMAITESLTKRHLQLLEAARDAFGWKSVWSIMRNIYAFVGEKNRWLKTSRILLNLKHASVSYFDAVKR